MGKEWMDPPPPPTSRFRAFTTALGFKASVPRSSSDQSSSPQRPVSTSAIRPLYGNFTLYLRVHSARGLPAVTHSSYCKLYLGDTPLIGGFGQGKSLVGGQERNLGNSHQTFHTKVQSSAARDCPEWNEKFQMNVRDPNTEVLTIRVKNHVLIYSPAIGACVVHLRQLQLGRIVDEWFPLYKNDKASGQIRLQICVQEKEFTPEPKRRYSQPSEEMIQRLMQQHRELEEAQRRELEWEQRERWRQLENDAMKRVGLEEQIEREEKRRQQGERRKEKDQEKEEKQQIQAEDSDSDLPPSFKNRGVEKEEKDATQLLNELNLRQDLEKKEELETKFGVPSGYTIDAVDSGYGPGRQLTSFGTIRLSVEDLDQVVLNALPSSDSSDSTDSEQESRRRRNRENKKKRRGRKTKKHSKRRVYSDEDSSSASSTRYRKKSSSVKVPEEKFIKKKATQGSVSSRSEESNQHHIHPNENIPITLTFPPSESIELSSSSSDEERRRRRRRRRRAEKTKKRGKERKRRSKRKPAKSRRNYESSYSSSSLFSSSSSSLSSSLSSSEEERLRRKLKKSESRKAKGRAVLNESGDSRASTRTSGMEYHHKLSYDDDSRAINSNASPYLAQHWRPEQADFAQVDATQSVSQSSRNGEDIDNSNTCGADGVWFDEPDQTLVPQYLGQTTKEQTNAELMRSFCF